MIVEEIKGELSSDDIEKLIIEKYSVHEEVCNSNQSDVLVNRLGIRSKEILSSAELQLSSKVLYDTAMNPIAGKYDFEHLCRFHEKIFGSIYPWAGNPRTVQIEKAEKNLGYMSIVYAQPRYIKHFTTESIDRMKMIEWESLPIDDQAVNLAECLAELWKIHPFREGNTRTIITFVCQFAESQGMILDRSYFSRNAKYTRDALVAATAVFPDADFRKPEYLLRIVKHSLQRKE